MRFTPVLRMAIAYPLRNRFRTGVTFAMFTLVVFTLVVGAVISGLVHPQRRQPGEVRRRVRHRAHRRRRRTRSSTWTRRFGSAGLDPNKFTVVAEQSLLVTEARQAGYDDEFADYPVRGFDRAYLGHTTYGMAALARGYESADEVWQAIARTPRLAVVDAIVAPRRDNWNAGNVPPDFKLHGFVLEDGVFEPFTVQTRDPQTGKTLNVTVIGILADTVPLELAGIWTSQETLAAAYGNRVRPTAYWYATADGVDARALAPKLESAFVANGLEADSLDEVLEDTIAVSLDVQPSDPGVHGARPDRRHRRPRRDQRPGGRGAPAADRDPQGSRVPAPHDPAQLPDRVLVHRADRDRGRDAAWL